MAFRATSFFLNIEKSPNWIKEWKIKTGCSRFCTALVFISLCRNCLLNSELPGWGQMFWAETMSSTLRLGEQSARVSWTTLPTTLLSPGQWGGRRSLGDVNEVICSSRKLLFSGSLQPLQFLSSVFSWRVWASAGGPMSSGLRDKKHPGRLSSQATSCSCSPHFTLICPACLPVVFRFQRQMQRQSYRD